MPLMRNSAVSMILYIINIYLLRILMLLTRNKCVAMSEKKCKVKSQLSILCESMLISSAQILHS